MALLLTFWKGGSNSRAMAQGNAAELEAHRWQSRATTHPGMRANACQALQRFAPHAEGRFLSLSCAADLQLPPASRVHTRVWTRMCSTAGVHEMPVPK